MLPRLRPGHPADPHMAVARTTTCHNPRAGCMQPSAHLIILHNMPPPRVPTSAPTLTLAKEGKLLAIILASQHQPFKPHKELMFIAGRVTTRSRVLATSTGEGQAPRFVPSSSALCLLTGATPAVTLTARAIPAHAATAAPGTSSRPAHDCCANHNLPQP